jgi:ATP-dependent RNA helicase DeaD
MSEPNPVEPLLDAQIVPSDYRSDRTFEELPLSPEIKRGIAEKGYLVPTPVQAAVLEPLLAGKDLIVRSKTGTGKTAAFGIPVLERIPTGTNEVRAIVLCPTRELALQVADEIQSLGKHKGSKVVAIYGGASMPQQVAALQQGGEIVVGTPGRVYDHIRRGTLKLNHAQVAVLDEADEMLSMGFFEEVTRILDELPEERQTLLFSATVPQDIQQIIENYLHDPQTILLSGDVFTVEGIENVIYYTVDSYPKPRNLLYLVEREEPDNAIIFCNTRDDTSLITAVLNRNGYDAEYLNGDLPQKERERVMAKIKAGEVRFMVATDIAARGIDISDLTHVINYSLPEDPAVYLHRIGRTGRIGKDGVAISLVSGRELMTLTALEKRYGIKFEERKLPTPEEAQQLWIDRHIAQLADGSQGSVFEAFLPLAQALRERPGSDALVAFALKYFFHHHQMELAAQQAAANAHSKAAERPPREPRARETKGTREPPAREARPRREGREETKRRPNAEPRLEGSAAAEGPAAARLYLNWGDLDPLPPAELVPALATASGLEATAVERGLSVDGRRGFLALPPSEAEKILALNGLEIGGHKLRAEVARVGPPRKRRRH